MPVTQAVAAQAGAKRKRNQVPKLYAVRAGHRPGIYHSWPECLSEVKGFKGAQFKSFQTLTEAEAFVAGKKSTAINNSTAKNKFYAVKRGKVPGIYTDWPSAQKQITGWTKPVYKSFSTRAEARRFQESDSLFYEDEPLCADLEHCLENGSSEDRSSTKKPKAAFAPGSTTPNEVRLASSEGIFGGYDPALYLPPEAEDGFDKNIILKRDTSDIVFKSKGQRDATKLEASGQAPGNMLYIYTDGSSLRNGQEGACAGVGVYFGPRDTRCAYSSYARGELKRYDRNISEPLSGKQTNQRAELTAVLRALDTAPKDRDITIITDSRYAINCATKWIEKWRTSSWKTIDGKNVENRDIIENIVGKMDERSALQSRTKFEWIKGHADFQGNKHADKLAVEAARTAAKLLAA